MKGLGEFVRKLSSQEYENLVYDIIRYCKKWGMWEGVKIFCEGKSFSDALGDSEGKVIKEGFRELKDVVVTEHDDPTDYICQEDEDMEGFVNPDHILSMVFDGPLCTLLGSGVYEVEWNDIEQHGREYLIREGSVLEKYCDYDPDEVESILNQDEFDSYEEYEKLEEEMQNEALLNMIQDLTFETICYELDSVSDYIESEFRKILDKYGIWYEMGHSWSLTCYYQ